VYHGFGQGLFGFTFTLGQFQVIIEATEIVAHINRGQKLPVKINHLTTFTKV